MKNEKTIAIIAIVIILAVFGAVAAFAKTTSIKEVDPTETSSGGIGSFLACLINPASCVKK